MTRRFRDTPFPPAAPGEDQLHVAHDRRLAAGPEGTWFTGESALGRMCLAVWLTVGLHLVDVGRVHPDETMPVYMDEGGPLQNLQLVLLGWALGLAIHGMWRFEGTLRGVMTLLVGPSFYLFWREADWDKDYISAWLGVEGIRMFSWRYLAAGPEFPLKAKLILGTVSLGLLGWWLALCYRCRAALGTLLQAGRSRPAFFWLLMAFLWLAIPQFPDRAWMPKDIRTGLIAEPFLEEAPEVLGELAFAFMVLMIAERLRKLDRAARSGTSARRVAEGPAHSPRPPRFGEDGAPRSQPVPAGPAAS